MKSIIKHINNTKKKITVDIPLAEVNAAFDAAYRTVGKKADVKGFRKGKIPPTVLEKFYSSDIAMESLNGVINESYAKVIVEYTLRPASDPKFDLKPLEKGKDYGYSVELEVFPHFEVKDYSGISLKKIEPVVTDKELDETLSRFQESRAELKPVEEGVALAVGHVAVLDVDGHIEGKPFPGGTGKGIPVELGKSNHFPEFEKKLVGLKKEEVREFDLKLPEQNFDPSVRGKEAHFKVTLQGLHSKTILPLDDEFAKDVGKENLAALKDSFRQNLLKRKEQEVRQEYVKEAVDHLVKKNQVELPDGYLAHQVEHAKGASKEDVEKRIRLELILGEIATKEKIRVEPKELNARIHEISQATGRPLADLQKFYADQNNFRQFITQLTFEKTLDFIVDKATLK